MKRILVFIVSLSVLVGLANQLQAAAHEVRIDRRSKKNLPEESTILKYFSAEGIISRIAELERPLTEHEELSLKKIINDENEKPHLREIAKKLSLQSKETKKGLDQVNQLKNRAVNKKG